MVVPTLLKATRLTLSPIEFSAPPPTLPVFPAHFGPGWGAQPQQLPHLGDGRLKDDVADGLWGRAEHRDHHHQHVRPLGQGVLSEVEEDTEAMLIIHCHRKDAACGEGGNRQQSSRSKLALQQPLPITQTPYVWQNPTSKTFPCTLPFHVHMVYFSPSLPPSFTLAHWV